MAKALTDIRSMARTHTETCIRVLVHIASESSAPHSARVAAAQVLLDRGWGKPLQQHEIGAVGDFDRMSDDELRALLMQEVAALGLITPLVIEHDEHGTEQ